MSLPKNRFNEYERKCLRKICLENDTDWFIGKAKLERITYQDIADKMNYMNKEMLDPTWDPSQWLIVAEDIANEIREHWGFYGRAAPPEQGATNLGAPMTITWTLQEHPLHGVHHQLQEYEIEALRFIDALESAKLQPRSRYDPAYKGNRLERLAMSMNRLARERGWTALNSNQRAFTENGIQKARQKYCRNREDQAGSASAGQ